MRRGNLYLTSRGVKVVGTDGWSWDPPFNLTAKKWLETKDPSTYGKDTKPVEKFRISRWKAHNLEKIPADGFTVACFPVKIEGASAG